MSYRKIDPEFKVKWLKALRSGRYKQERAALRRGPEVGYCCIGVACNVVNPRKWKPEGISMFAWGDWESAKDDNFLEFGLTAATTRRLIKMNDDLHWDFNQIADWVEKYL